MPKVYTYDPLNPVGPFIFSIRHAEPDGFAPYQNQNGVWIVYQSGL